MATSHSVPTDVGKKKLAIMQIRSFSSSHLKKSLYLLAKFEVAFHQRKYTQVKN